MFAKVNDKGEVVKYPYTFGMLKKDHPNVSFPKVINDDVLTQFNMVRVTPTDRPAEDHTKNFVLTATRVGDNGWMEWWTPLDATQDEIAERTSNKAAQVRDERDGLLTKSDWTQVADAPVDSQAWSVYRQSLRDIPSQEGFPWNVVWPTQPE